MVLENLINGRTTDLGVRSYLTEVARVLPAHMFDRVVLGRDSLKGAMVSKLFSDGSKLRITFSKGQYSIVVQGDEKSLTQLKCTARELLNPFHPHYYLSYGTKIKRGDVVVDCGAGEGLFTAIAERMASMVYSIEPLPSFALCLRYAFSDKPNIKIMEYALGDRNQIMGFEDDGTTSRLSSKGQIDVAVRTVDSLFFDEGIPIDYIKADLEGSEIDMLRGAEKTIESCKPRIAIATYDGPDYALRVKKLLRKCNPSYRVRSRGITCRLNAESDGNMNWPVLVHAC